MTQAPTTNPVAPLDVTWLGSIRVNRSAVERRAASLPGRRSVKKDWQIGWLLRAVSCIDLTTLSGDDTPGSVARLCAKARNPLRPDVAAGLGVADLRLRVAAVCVYPSLVGAAVQSLAGSGIPVAAVATGFPSGQIPLPEKLAEIRAAVAAGASEIDVVISRGLVLRGEWRAVYDEVRAFKEACGPAHMKTILATGELGTLTQIARASHVCMAAGADFIKTSTGKEAVNATIPVGLVMARAIREHLGRTGRAVGLKPAGGIRTAKQAIEWLALMVEELGEAWTRPDRFRLGASGLLTDIERQLEHGLSGRYAAAHRHPMV